MMKFSVFPYIQTLPRFYYIFASLVLVILVGVTHVSVLSPAISIDTPARPAPVYKPSNSSLNVLDERMATTITQKNRDFKYLPKLDILVVGMAKSGTTSFWDWIYSSTKGEPYNCSTYIQNMNSACWGDDAVYLFQMNSTQRLNILTSPKTLRVALWRDPFQRCVSAWKSKITCEVERFDTDVERVGMIVQNIRINALLPPVKCMNITEYANTLDKLRLRVTSGELKMKNIDAHIRVQEHYSDWINYHSVLKISDAARNPSLLAPIVERMNRTDIALKGLPHLHGSKGEKIDIPEDDIYKIMAFVGLTNPEPVPTSERNVV